jgi:selenocysteine lyase/cysteine desulfurase
MSFTRDDSQRCRADFPALARTQAGRPLETLPTDVLPVQEHKPPYLIETGTLNHPSLEGVDAAVEYIASWGDGTTRRARIVDAMRSIGAYEHELGRYYHDEVRRIPGVALWGGDFSTNRRAPTVSITLDGVTPADAARMLGAEGICVWDGHFYAARAVEALGLAPNGLLRTGFSMYNQMHEIDRLLEALRRISS